MNLKKRNLVLQAAVASALLTGAAGVQAGITAPAALGANSTFASEIFGAGTVASATALVNSGNEMTVVYTLGVPRNATASTFQNTIVLTNGAQFNVAATTANIATANASAANTCAANVAVRSGGAAKDTQVIYDVTPTTGTCTVGDTLTFSTPNLRNAQALATAGTKIGVTWNLSDVLGALDTSGTHSVNIASSAASLSVTNAAVTATSTAPDIFSIDAIAQSSKYFVGTASATGSKTARLGTIKYGDVAASRLAANTGDRVRLIGDAINLTVTGNFAASTSIASSGGAFLSASSTCASVDVKATILTSTTATFTGVAGNTTNTSICMTVDGTNSIVASSYSATSVYVPAITTEASNTSTFSLATTSLNAQTADVRQYLPKAASTSYTQFVRIINAGSVDARITGVVYDDVTGIAGSEVELITLLKKGASTTLNSTDIEAKTGAIASSARPRIRILGATDNLQVQSFLFSAAGVGSFTAMMGKE